ncbi:hypothetical protein CTEN210_13428 [Chaetoceros tenuissimus]|uniref:Leucine-rich repeat domain-containing protein n=1 Tax=Chaetoceros tenuissimus TaxID=426638 RepID=A0AAD3D329_9STRA|nr:hypothetical protein CTEN210_13428 [Chaetoceros tenuissimus]
MRLQRDFTNKEWKEIGEKYKDGGVHMYKGKRTFFYNGEKLLKENEGPLIYNYKERDSWEVMIVLPGVEVIHYHTFDACENIKTVIMADTVKRIEEGAFEGCYSLEFVKLSRNLEYIGDMAFHWCKSLTSIFIPPSCREIGSGAFCGCHQLLIIGMSLHTELGEFVFQNTAVLKNSSISIDKDGFYEGNDDERVIRWVKSINDEDVYALHHACSSINPLGDIIHDLVKQQGIKAMRIPNAIGVTPSQYLEANTFADISEKDIINRYILDSMGEVI